ncbi:MAG: hypothetical protein AAGI03_17950 [Pseudomonadota bacterium]
MGDILYAAATSGLVLVIMIAAFKVSYSVAMAYGEELFCRVIGFSAAFITVFVFAIAATKPVAGCP